ncbi:hypothetical protein [Bradyrhizobium betae]|uniref:Uncharacterized protein n=1 Tax=Bradyrhizobium betae TaxID=244734 RepID=A0A5P6P016_9BRAD|nr:hypothetical protein [Bradyrhizobium betae]MCS3731707.1 hypothetical protein [Bradyrhizobium betae]QFI71697.1 hypothetical protein F8237_04505 [Bradyrhizobium betae]
MPTLIAVVAALLVGLCSANAAPQQLYGKGIHIQYTVTATIETPRGPHSGTSSVDRTIYVSNTGRLFERAVWSTRGARGVSDNSPGATTNKAGEARGMSFRGNELVAHIAYLSGAGRMTIHFDPTFSTCDGELVFGAEPGKAMSRRAIGGSGTFQFRSLQPSRITCSVTAGNPLQ